MDTDGLRAFLDTHAAVFLWEGRTDIWGTASRELLVRTVAEGVGSPPPALVALPMLRALASAAVWRS